jgi:hypothetical protein
MGVGVQSSAKVVRAGFPHQAPVPSDQRPRPGVQTARVSGLLLGQAWRGLGAVGKPGGLYIKRAGSAFSVSYDCSGQARSVHAPRSASAAAGWPMHRLLGVRAVACNFRCVGQVGHDGCAVRCLSLDPSRTSMPSGPPEALTIAGRYTGRVISKVQPFEVVSVSRRLPP